MIRAVVFDVGETLVDETRVWSALAGAAGVTPLTLAGALGVLIERGEHHRHVWELLGVRRPEFTYEIRSGDLYPDALPAMARLRRAGLRLGVAGNQPDGAVEALEGLGLDVDFIASSARWGVEKPAAEFFDRVVAAAGVGAAEIAYVGDRLHNDVLPALAAGMFAVLIRRGPWGYLHAQRPEAARADARIESLSELASVLGELPSSRGEESTA